MTPTDVLNSQVNMASLTGDALLDKLETVEFIGTGPDGLAPTPGEAMCSSYIDPQFRHKFIADNSHSYLRSLAADGLLVDHRVHHYGLQEIKTIFLRLRALSFVNWHCSKRLFILTQALLDTMNQLGPSRLSMFRDAVSDTAGPRADRQERKWAAREA